MTWYDQLLRLHLTKWASSRTKRGRPAGPFPKSWVKSGPSDFSEVGTCPGRFPKSSKSMSSVFGTCLADDATGTTLIRTGSSLSSSREPAVDFSWPKQSTRHPSIFYPEFDDKSQGGWASWTFLFWWVKHVPTSPETSTKGLLEEEGLQGLSYARLSGEEDEQEPDIFAVGFTQWQKPSPSQHHSCGDSSHPQMGVCICPSISRRHVWVEVIPTALSMYIII